MHKLRTRGRLKELGFKFEFMWPQQVTMWSNQENMHVQYSDTVINILVRNSGKRLLCLYARRAPMRILDIFDPRTLFSA